MQNTKRSDKPYNVPREFGAPIRRPQRDLRPVESFEDFRQDLYKHEWSHTTNNYSDYIKSVKAESALFSRAMSLGPTGVDMFRRMKEDSMRELVGVAVSQAIRTERATGSEQLDQQKAALMAIMTPEQKAAVEFMDRLWYHDWYYDYTDDGNVWRNANERHKAFLKEAKEGGKVFEDMWLHVYKTRMGKEANEAWTFAQHYARHHGAY